MTQPEYFVRSVDFLVRLLAQDEDFDITMKFLVVGDSAVGKSSLLVQFCDGTFTENFLSTIGIDFKVKVLDVEGQTIKIQIWDTAGQERFRTITTAYYRGAQGILLVYDVTAEDSFENLRSWLQSIDKHAPAHCAKLIIGNKNDLFEKKCVARERVLEMSRDLDIPFFEASAKTNENVEEAFLELVGMVLKKTGQSSSARGGPAGGRGSTSHPDRVELSPSLPHKRRCCTT